MLIPKMQSLFPIRYSYFAMVYSSLKINLYSIRFFVRFCQFFYVFASPGTSLSFFIRIFVSSYHKSFPKKIFCKMVQPYFEILLLSFIHKIFEQNFCQYTTVYLVRKWTYKNANEKAHTFSPRSKNVKKKNKRGRKTDTA